MRSAVCGILVSAAAAAAAGSGSLHLRFEPRDASSGARAAEGIRPPRTIPSSLEPAAHARRLLRPVLAAKAEELGGPAAASGSVQFAMNSQGWNYLTITTNSSCDDEFQAYGAGYLEASLTAAAITDGIANTGANATWDPALASYLADNAVFLHQQILANPTDPYWVQAWLIQLQLQGLYDGYVDAVGGVNSPAWVPFSAFINIQISGDMDDLSTALGLQAGLGQGLPHPRLVHRRNARLAAGGAAAAAAGDEASTRRQLLAPESELVPPTTEGGGHCSAAVRVLPGNADIWIAQTAWSGFEDMLRVYKHIDLGYVGGSLPGRTAVYASYPGSTFSGDDFYQMAPSQLVMLETTIGNSNATLYKLYITPQSVLEWMRNLIANRLAGDAPSWAAIYTRYNSGTYNNENFILDYKLFTPGMTALPDNLFWVVDQAPGFMGSLDRTEWLRSAGYVGSYNVASDPFIYNITGVPAVVAQYGPWFSWNNTARANIFRRDAPGVVDQAGFQRLIRYNDFTHDPLATQACEGRNPPYSAENAIAARDDLNPAGGNYSIGALGHRDHAAIDAKATSYALQMAPGGMTALIQAGPTYDQQPAFVWSTAAPDIAALPHAGQPDSWTMPWLNLQFTTGGGINVVPATGA